MVDTSIRLISTSKIWTMNGMEDAKTNWAYANKQVATKIILWLLCYMRTLYVAIDPPRYANHRSKLVVRQN